MARSGILKTAAFIAVVIGAQALGKAILPIENHASDIPDDTPEEIVEACSVGSAFSFAGIYKSSHTTLDATCATFQTLQTAINQIDGLEQLEGVISGAFPEASEEVDRQIACAREQGIESPSFARITSGGYCL